jgi:hypothetical protein
MALGLMALTMNEVMDKLRAVTFDWDAYSVMSKPFADKLFQKVLAYNNQPERWKDGKMDGDATPQAYVELLPSEVIPFLCRGTDMRDLNIRIHVVDQQLDAGDGTQDQNFAVFEYRDEVKKSLDRFKISKGGRLMQTNEEQDNNHTNVYHLMIDFKAALIDSTGSPFDIPYEAPGDGLTLDLTQQQEQIPPGHSPYSLIYQWYAGTPYTALKSIVSDGQASDGVSTGYIYLCLQSNYDTVFDKNNTSKWLRLFFWVSGKSYIIGDYVYKPHSYGLPVNTIPDHLYQCITPNSDTEFTASNWELIL